MQDLTIKLLGNLGIKYGRTHELQADRVSEGISYLRYQLEDFESHLLSLHIAGYKLSAVFQQGGKNIQIDDPQWLNIEIVSSATLILSPVPAAAGNAGKFLVGVGLIAISAFLPATIGILGATISSSAVGLYGANLVIGSIIDFLKKPNPEQKNSTIAGTVATGSQGQPIPIVYGRTYVTPTVISGGTAITDHSTYETRGDGGFFGIGGWSETYLAPRSTTKLQVVDALCEGPIGGLVNGEQGIWINGIPIKNSANQYSYLGMQTETYDLYGNKTVVITTPTLRQGYGNDAALPAPWDYASGDTSVGQTLKAITGSAIRRINRANIDTINVRIYWQACNNYAGTDQLGGLRTAHQISIREGNGAWAVRHVDDIYALSSSPFERQFTFTVGSAPYYEVKVERIIPDQPADKAATRVDVGTWKSYGIGINSKLQYPHTAKIGIEINLERFGATEADRRYHINGKIIKIPSNATVRADGSLQYTGLWNGVLVDAWSSDPAWCLYDLLLNKRYGLGIKARKLDKFAFYASSTYCSELVPDGFGGMEPRFGLNCIIKDRGAAYDLIQKLCGVFNSIAFYESGAISPSTDRPKSISHQFVNSNAMFKYAGTAWRSRRNKVTVAYDRSEAPDLRDYEFAEAKADILARGVIENRLDAFGCNSRGQAKRVAKWSLYTEQYQKESITIVGGMQLANVYPGQVVSVADRDRQAINRAGLVASATTSTITIDEPVNLPAGVFTLYVTLPDGSIENRSISNTGNNLTSINVITPFSVAPNAESAWLIDGYDVNPEQWLIMGRSESGLHQYELTGISYDPSKFAFIEQGLNLVEPPKPIVIPSPPLPPSNLQLAIVNGIGTSIVATWNAPTPSTYTVGYQVQYKQIGNLVSSPIGTSTTNYLIGSITGYGDYEVQVRAVDVNGFFSGWITADISISSNVFFAESLLASRSQTMIDFKSSSVNAGDTMEARCVSSIKVQPEPQVTFKSCEKIVILNPAPAPPPPMGINLIYNSFGDTNGLFYYLGTNNLSQSWVNPLTASNVIASSNYIASGEFQDPQSVANRSPLGWASDDFPNSWITFDIGVSKQIIISNYTLKSRSTNGFVLPRNWRLEGTNSIPSWDISGVNSATWTTIQSESGNAVLNAPSTWGQINIGVTPLAYRYLRLYQYGSSSTIGYGYFTIGEVEFYGTLI